MEEKYWRSTLERKNDLHRLFHGGLAHRQLAGLGLKIIYFGFTMKKPRQMIPGWRKRGGWQGVFMKPST